MPRLTAKDLAECIQAKQDNIELTVALLAIAERAGEQDGDPETALEEIVDLARHGLEKAGDLATVALNILPEPDQPGNHDLARMIERISRLRAGLPDMAIVWPERQEFT
jgi:hypothetical protein